MKQGSQLDVWPAIGLFCWQRLLTSTATTTELRAVSVSWSYQLEVFSVPLQKYIHHSGRFLPGSGLSSLEPLTIYKKRKTSTRKGPNASPPHPKRTHAQVHKQVTLCKQGTNPDNFAHKVELDFSLQSKPWLLCRRSASTKGHCSYHLKCEPTALCAFS